MAGTYFAAVGIRFWVKVGTVASAPPTSTAGMTEVLSVTDNSIQNSNTSQRVNDYSSELGYGKSLVTESGYSLPCNLNLDPTSDGYKILRRAGTQAANGVTLQWFRQLPVVAGTDALGQCDAGVAIVSQFQESLATNTVATMTFNLEGQGAPMMYQQGSAIATLTITNGGVGLTAGTGVALVSTSPAQGSLSGRNATVTTTVSSGVITGATIVAGGQNYKVGDILTITDPTVFGTGDTAPILTVATVA
jgi:hypothetical protein